MWLSLKRLAPGFVLIVLAALVLLLSDTSRRPGAGAPAPRIALLQHASQIILDEGFAASSVLARGAQAIWIGADVTVLTGADSLIAAARQAGVPVFTSTPGIADRGALFDIGANYHEVGRLAGVLAGEVLKGRDPATVPIENVVPETLVVNRAALGGLIDPWRVPGEVVRTARLVGETPSAPAKSEAAMPKSAPAAPRAS